MRDESTENLYCTGCGNKVGQVMGNTIKIKYKQRGVMLQAVYGPASVVVTCEKCKTETRFTACPAEVESENPLFIGGGGRNG